MIGNASGIDLNNATVNQLSRIGGLGRVLAARIVERRPFRRWAELEEVEGLDHEMVNNLRGSGAKLGRAAAAAKPRKLYARVLRDPAPPKKDFSAATRKGRRARPSKNIFSGEGRIRE